jgi:hypothetical protein
LSFPQHEPCMHGGGGRAEEGMGDDGEESIDGVPVVRLHDSAADVTTFLCAISIPRASLPCSPTARSLTLHTKRFFEPSPHKSSLPSILGILRLSHKYDIPYLPRRALLHLDTGFPTSLGVYNVSGSETFSSDGLNDSLLTIQVASEVGATWVLPAAFYFLRYSDLKDILAAPQRAHHSELDRGVAVSSYTRQRLACLPALPFLRIPFTEGCTALNTCDVYKAAYLADVPAWNISDPLGSYKDWSPFEGKICAYCLERSGEYHRAARRRLWEELPGVYGLPGWEVLEGMKREALRVEGEE